MPGDLDGLLQPARALSSPLVAGGGGDGLLTMGEILGLKLNAEWAVLSACNTAAAEGAGAEAVEETPEVPTDHDQGGRQWARRESVGGSD